MFIYDSISLYQIEWMGLLFQMEMLQQTWKFIQIQNSKQKLRIPKISPNFVNWTELNWAEMKWTVNSMWIGTLNTLMRGERKRLQKNGSVTIIITGEVKSKIRIFIFVNNQQAISSLISSLIENSSINEYDQWWAQ